MCQLVNLFRVLNFSSITRILFTKKETPRTARVFNVDSRAHLSNTKILPVGFDAIKVSTKMEIPKDLFEGL